MGLPFLDEVNGFTSAAERRAAIADEVNLYLWALEDPDYDEKGNPVLPPKPSALIWKEWSDRYGLPEPGGWLDQPFGFLYDIEAARAGMRRYQKEKQINEMLTNG